MMDDEGDRGAPRQHNESCHRPTAAHCPSWFPGALGACVARGLHPQPSRVTLSACPSVPAPPRPPPSASGRGLGLQVALERYMGTRWARGPPCQPPAPIHLRISAPLPPWGLALHFLLVAVTPKESQAGPRRRGGGHVKQP